MKIGISATCYGPHSTGDFIRRSAQAAERAGFNSFWFGDHVVLMGAYPDSPYPYADVTKWDDSGAPPPEESLGKGEPPVPDPRFPLYEPVTAMTWAAAATTTLEFGTAILILPQRNPVVLAKELSCLDEYSQGRVTLGAGVGWCKEESDAIGKQWRTRGKRTDEYIDAMRVLWSQDAGAYEGTEVSFKDAYMYPRPVRGSIPIMIGGDTDIALKRVARRGDGWLAFNLPVETAAQRIAWLKELTREQGRDPEALRISASIFSFTDPDDLPRYRDAGVTEFLLYKSGELSLDDALLNEQIAEAAHRFMTPVAD